MKTIGMAICATTMAAMGALAAPPLVYDIETNWQQNQSLPNQSIMQGANVEMHVRLRSRGRWLSLTGLTARWEARASAGATQALVAASAATVVDVTPHHFVIRLGPAQTGSSRTNWVWSLIVESDDRQFPLGVGRLGIVASGWTGERAVLLTQTAAAYTDAAVAARVPMGRRLTIDGVTHDLSSDRVWTTEERPEIDPIWIAARAGYATTGALAAVESRVDTVDGFVGYLAQGVGALDQRADALNQRTDDLETSADALVQRTDALAQGVGALETQARTFATTGAVAAVESRVEAIEATLAPHWVVASGGSTNYTYTNAIGTHRVHVFAASGTFTVSRGGRVRVCVVGGGGGGGGYRDQDNVGGGGGGGGVVVEEVIVEAGEHTILVGQGGVVNQSGEASSAFGVIALGGGAGGWGDTILGSPPVAAVAGHDGGSGGGGGFTTGSEPQPLGGRGTWGHGHDGASARASLRIGGGGGGAGARAIESSGGMGRPISFGGRTTTFGGGGGGGTFHPYSQPGGGGGGGANDMPGEPNTGGGGGGSGDGIDVGRSVGGSGIVMIEYQIE